MAPRRIGSIIGLRSEWVDRYRALHDNVFPGVLERLTRSNIRNYSIFLGPADADGDAGTDGRARTLFSYMEYVGENYSADMAAIAADETTERWWSLTDPMQLPLPERAEGEWWATLSEWHAFDAEERNPATRRLSFASRRPPDIPEEDLSRVRDVIGRAHVGIRTFRAFAARGHLYTYLEVTPEFAEVDFAEVFGRALGGRAQPTPMTEVFHTDGGPPPRKKVFVSGCFDMLHSGHVAFLEEAAGYGDLYVGIGSDATIHELKGRYTVNPEDERRYMIQALACVTECRVNSGRGMLDFEADLRRINPDILVTNEDGHLPGKEALCRSLGIEYRVLRRVPHAGLPARSTTALRVESRIPYRIDLAGGWLDQPYVSKFHPGPVLTISIEPTVEFNDRSGMASSTRRKAIELWRTNIPHGDRETLARALFGFENPPGTLEVAGSQDALGIVLPGLNRLDYSGDYWPGRIESVHDEEVLGWIEAHLSLVTLGPRVSDYTVINDTRIDVPGAKALADAACDCWNAVLARDVRAFGDAFRRSFEAQVTMFPRMVDDDIQAAIDRYRERTLGWKLSGAGGGGYLILVAEKPVENAMRIKIRRNDGD